MRRKNYEQPRLDVLAVAVEMPLFGFGSNTGIPSIGAGSSNSNRTFESKSSSSLDECISTSKSYGGSLNYSEDEVNNMLQ